MAVLALAACRGSARGPDLVVDSSTGIPQASAGASSPDAALPPPWVDAPDDVSTDAAAAAAYERLAPRLGIHTADPSGAHAGACVTRPARFGGLVLVARAVQDLGCYGAAAFFAGRLYASKDAVLPLVMAKEGWASGPAALREELARAWALTVALVPSTVVTRRDETCVPRDAGATFQPPAVETLADGRVRVRAWFEEQRAFFRIPEPCRPRSVTFAADGSSAMLDVP